MTMMRRRGNSSAVRGLFGVVVLVSVALLITNVDALRQPLTGAVHAIGRPLAGAGNTAVNSVGGLFQYLRAKQALIDENQSLREEVRLMGIKLADRELLRDEVARLRAEMPIRATTSSAYITAGVVSRPSRTPYDTIIVDTGIDDGVDQDNLVSVGGVGIGRVSEVLAHSAKITLFSSVGQKTDVLLGATAIPAEAVGRGAGNFEILVPRDLEISVGDAVRLPGATPYLVGTVSVINADPNDAFKQVLFRSPVSPLALVTVRIILD